MKGNLQQSSDGAQTERNHLDNALDSALAKYAEVEPRAGIEQRILAHLRSQQEGITTHSWRQWSAVGVVATLLVVAAAIAWKANRPAKNLVQRHPSPPIETMRPATQIAATSTMQTAVVIRQTHRATRREVHRPALADSPKLDQFPSPRPLSEQEKLALEYVAKFPEEASLIAQAQNNLARQQELEERRSQSPE